MRRAVVALVVLGLLGLAAPATAARPRGESFTRYEHDGDADHKTPPDLFWVYRPVSAVGRAPLVVYLHGCYQWVVDDKGNVDVPLGTRWNDLADREGVVVAYPQQSRSRNGAGCWNWFEPDEQERGDLEPALLAAITRRVIDEHRINPSRVFVMGMSAGADMATILGATYPDLFAAAGGVAGCAYATCTDVHGVGAHAAMGENQRVLPAFLLQGDADPLNNVAMGETAVRQWVGTNGIAAGRPLQEEKPEEVEAVEGDERDAGDVACGPSWHWPCVGGALGYDAYPHTIRRWSTASCNVVEAWTVHGLSHNYPGGNPGEGRTYTDPVGPSASEAAWAFFDQHRRGAPCGGG